MICYAFVFMNVVYCSNIPTINQTIGLRWSMSSLKIDSSWEPEFDFLVEQLLVNFTYPSIKFRINSVYFSRKPDI